MSTHRFFPPKILICAIVFFIAIWVNHACTKKLVSQGETHLAAPSVGMDTINRWVSWNVLFKEGTSSAATKTGLSAIENDIRTYIRSFDPTYNARFRIFYCPCDTLLFNMAVTPIDASGQSVSVPAPPPSAPGGSGDVLYVSHNNLINTEDTATLHLTSDKVVIPSSVTVNRSVLAVIDTGIDTTLFSSKLRDLVWAPPAGVAGLFNFVSNIRSERENFRDDHIGRHGTAVTALALHAMNSSATRPRIMVLKALNSRKQGSTFTVSCALSYAVQNSATVINASLGYYETGGTIDSVFRHYVAKCNTVSPEPIVIFAAAGNMPGTHNPAWLCNPATAFNRLTGYRLFYPACFSASMSHVVSVTGLSSLYNTSCLYQNYSSDYVSIGVLNNGDCCKYYIPFLASGYEGSSYATPVACGKAMSCMPAAAGAGILNCVQSSSLADPRWLSVVKDGRFMNYDDDRIW